MAPEAKVRAGGNLVTVVIPARNEETSIRGCLDSVLRQDWRELEILVIDGASTDSTRSIVLDYERTDDRVRLLNNRARVIPISLNLGLSEARGAWLVRVDAHATIPTDYVRRAVGHLSTGSYGGVGGRKDGKGVTAAGRAIAAAMSSRFGVGGSTYHFGSRVQYTDHVPFGAYPVETLRSLGGWNDKLEVNQDFELDYRLRQCGYQILFDPAMQVSWQSRQSIRALAMQYRRYGRGKVQVALLHPRSLKPRHGAAPALVAWLAASAVTAVRRPAVGVAMALPYVVALTLASRTVARALDPASRRYVAPAFVAMHVSWGVGFWEGVIRGLAQLLARLARQTERETPSPTDAIHAQSCDGERPFV